MDESQLGVAEASQTEERPSSIKYWFEDTAYLIRSNGTLFLGLLLGGVRSAAHDGKARERPRTTIIAGPFKRYFNSANAPCLRFPIVPFIILKKSFF